MKRRLWTVLVDQVPMAVVAAVDIQTAWVIVRAMEDFDDLPEGVNNIEIEPSSDEESLQVMDKARKRKTADRFLAHLSNGQFILSYGALSVQAFLSQRGRLAA